MPGQKAIMQQSSPVQSNLGHRVCLMVREHSGLSEVIEVGFFRKLNFCEVLLVICSIFAPHWRILTTIDIPHLFTQKGRHMPDNFL
jgi:hypothetical protein